MAEQHRVLAREQREFDAQERRYEDRRKAVSDFQAELLDIDYKNYEFWVQHQVMPGQTMDSLPFPRLHRLLAEIEILATEPVIKAARDAVRVTHRITNAEDEDRAELRQAQTRFCHEVRVMLGIERA